MIINWTAICAWVSHCSQINKENSIITFYRLLYLSLPEVIHSKRDKHLLTTLKKKIKKKSILSILILHFVIQSKSKTLF